MGGTHATMTERFASRRAQIERSTEVKVKSPLAFPRLAIARISYVRTMSVTPIKKLNPRIQHKAALVRLSCCNGFTIVSGKKASEKSAKAEHAVQLVSLLITSFLIFLILDETATNLH